MFLRKSNALTIGSGVGRARCIGIIALFKMHHVSLHDSKNFCKFGSVLMAKCITDLSNPAHTMPTVWPHSSFDIRAIIAFQCQYEVTVYMSKLVRFRAFRAKDEFMYYLQSERRVYVRHNMMILR